MKSTKRTFRRALSLVLAVIMLLSTLPALNISAVELEVAESSADAPITEVEADKPVAEVSGTTSDGIGYTITDGEVEIDYYTGTASELVIPSTIDGYPVTNIGTYAFDDSINLTSVTIPDSVTSIGECAFSGCVSLISITIPKGVTCIESGTFVDCASLISITIPDSVTSIEGHAFSDCTNLKNIMIPSSVTSIGKCAFSYCVRLENVTIPDSVTSIGEDAFEYCMSLTSITIPDSVTSIGAGAFFDCTSLKSVTIPEGVTSIGFYAFSGCTSLQNITIPEGVTSLGGYAFENCTSLKSVTIPEGVTSIGFYAFSGCTSLESVTIPEGVTSLGEYAFENCTSLQNVTNLSGVTNISSHTFSGCSSLVNITIPDSVMIIEGWAFSGCRSLKNIIIPSSVTSIENSAFSGCTSLTSITIPEGVTSVGSCVFDFCTSLTEITVDENNPVYDSRENSNAIIETATNTLVYGCSTTVIPSSVTSIAGSSFAYCTNLQNITIPLSVTSIGDCAFSYCTNLQNVTIPSSVTSIDDYAFACCESLTSVTISEGVTSIGEAAFYDCYELESITIPSSVTSIRYDSFAGCPFDLTIYGIEGSYAETFAKENGINFNSTGEVPSDVVYDMNVYSDRSGMNVQVGEHIRLGVELFKEGEAAEEISVSDVSFVLDDSNIVKPLGFEIKDNIYFVEFEALKAGTAFVTFSDAATGFAAKVPVTAYDKSKTSFTLDSIVNFVNGYYLKDVASVSGIFADNYSYTVDEKTGKATVKFDAYNSSYIYGAVEVYDAQGNLADAVVLDKYESGATSLKEIFVDNPFHLYKDFVEGNYFSDTFYRAETYAKKTSVSVIIPKGGYITITTDAYSSDIVSIANCIDMLLQVKDVAGDIKGYREESSKFIKLTTEKAVEKIIKDSIKPKSIAKKLAKGFSKEFLMTKNSMGDFMDSVVNNINTLDIATFAIETAKGFAFGVGEEVAIALTGPGYKEVIKTLLTVGKITEIGNQYLDFVNSMDCGTIAIHNQEGPSRTSENVTVKCETSFDNDVALRVFNVVPESDLLETIKAKEPELYKAMMKDLSQVYNISMIKNGEETQPKEKVQVYIPLDPELLPYTGMGEVKVYRVEEDGSLTDMKAKLDGDFMVFTTEHFSLYVLAIEGVEDTDPTEPGTSEPTTPDASKPTQPEEGTTTEPDVSEPTHSEPESSVPAESVPTEPESSVPTEPEVSYLSGDANGDGKINVKDATQIQKAAASLVTLDEVQTLAADANGDGKVNVKDATAIQKFVAGIPVSFPIGEERKK